MPRTPKSGSPPPLDPEQPIESWNDLGSRLASPRALRRIEIGERDYTNYSLKQIDGFLIEPSDRPLGDYGEAPIITATIGVLGLNTGGNLLLDVGGGVLLIGVV
jgi:hypothetical protein